MQDHKLYQSSMSPDGFLQEYLQNRRELELSIMKEIVPHLKSAPGQLRMVTFVTMQDLWWPDRSKVDQFYRNGEYASYLDEIWNAKGKESFRHTFASGCLERRNFVTADGVVLKETSSGYDELVRLKNLNKALQEIKNLVP